MKTEDCLRLFVRQPNGDKGCRVGYLDAKYVRAKELDKYDGQRLQLEEAGHWSRVTGKAKLRVLIENSKC